MREHRGNAAGRFPVRRFAQVVEEERRGQHCAAYPRENVAGTAALIEQQETHGPDIQPLNGRIAPDHCGHHGAGQYGPAESRTVEEEEGRSQGPQDEIPTHLKPGKGVLELDEGKQNDRYGAIEDQVSRRERRLWVQMIRAIEAKRIRAPMYISTRRLKCVV